MYIRFRAHCTKFLIVCISRDCRDKAKGSTGSTVQNKRAVSYTVDSCRIAENIEITGV